MESREPQAADGEVRRAFFIDSENGMEALMDGFEVLNPSDTIIVFHRDTISKKTKNRLAMGPARVEWAMCVDPGVKNSMDVQIIAELAFRFAREKFDEGYVVSRDKGYLPAIHYLQRLPFAQGCELKLVNSIDQATHHSILRMLSDVDALDSREVVTRSFALFLGMHKAERLVAKLSGVLAPKEEDAAAEVPKANESETSVILDFASLGSKDANGEKLTDLKGIGSALSQKLKSAGVGSPAKLRRLGAAEAWRRVREQDPSFPLKWLYVFEAAITEGSLSGIGPERRQELKREAKAKVS